MKAGDLVKCDPWVHEGKTGIIVEVQGVTYCVSAHVLFDVGIKLVRLENLRRINERR